MKLTLILITLFCGNLWAQADKDKSSNQMTCEKVHGEPNISGKKPYIMRCENKKEICFSHQNGISCYAKPKE